MAGWGLKGDWVDFGKREREGGFGDFNLLIHQQSTIEEMDESDSRVAAEIRG
jgi:hypothetical protein